MLKLSVNEYQCEIQKDIAVTNLKRVNIFSKFMIILQLLVIVFLFLPLLRTSSDELKWMFQTFVGLHSILLLVGILGLLISTRFLKALVTKNEDARFEHKYMASLFLLVTLSLLAMITGLDQHLNNQNTMLIVSMVLSSLVFMIPFPKNLFTFGFPFIIYVMAILGFQTNQETALAHLITGAISFVAVVIVSTMLYKYHYQNLFKKYELEEANTRLRHLAKHDPLTDLLQRSEFELQIRDFMDSVQAPSPEAEAPESCLIFIDIDNFRMINQVYGYLTGDNVVKSVGKILREKLPNDAISSRWAGQEFLIVLPGTSGHDCTEVLEEIRLLFEKHPVPLEETDAPLNTQLYVTISVGVAPLSGTYNPGFNDAFKKASEALGNAKGKGKNTIEYYYSF